MNIQISDDLFQEAKKIPVVILAGGLGTRLSEETNNLPKPMVTVGGIPIIVHVMDSYAQYGFCNFIICGGYKVEEIKKYFLTLPYVDKNIEISFSSNMHEVKIKANKKPLYYNRHHWKVTILETGLSSMTGHRVRQAIDYLNENTDYDNFCLTYGDGLTDANLHGELKAHFIHNCIGSVLAVHNPSRFGIFEFNEQNVVTRFSEKPKEYINGGYFIFRKKIIDYLPENNPSCVFETEPLQNLALERQLVMYKHDGFWQCMDTKRDKDYLEKIFENGKVPWLKELR